MTALGARHIAPILGAACLLAAACESQQPALGSDAKPGALALPALCEREARDAVRDVFCAAAPPAIRSLYDLELELGLQTALQTQDVTYHNHPILLGHSTSLSGHLVSPLNPRAFLVGADVVLAFQRGVQRVELAAKDREGEGFNLYLLSIKQACNAEPEGCSSTDLFTPRIERDWTEIALQDDEALKNTPNDCRQCHRRGRDSAMLLMRELESPWTHFFDYTENMNDTEPGVRGSDLTRDYLAAHGGERYAGIDVENYPAIAPFALQRVVLHDQPVFFDAPKIERERWPQHDDGYAALPQASPTWERGYAAFRRGEQLAPPYLEVRASDPAKQAQLTAAYRAFLDGTRDDVPDLSDIFPDDPRLRARIGLRTEPDASPDELLIQACGPCHNDVLDQSLTRARFNIDVSRLDPGELSLAMDRIQLPPDQPGAMPPPQARHLDAAARTRIVSYLQAVTQGGEGARDLAYASEVGFARSTAAER
jgi:hypothetical protein